MLCFRLLPPVFVLEAEEGEVSESVPAHLIGLLLPGCAEEAVESCRPDRPSQCAD